jgi:DNA-directed RNA polymerase sigma subunit (sigma70/sigma32)
MLGITRERVRQIQEKAMSKLRAITRIQDYHDIC